MRKIFQRVAHKFEVARRLNREGLTIPSIFLYHVRRRLLNPRNQIDLKNRISFTSPPDEPLLTIFDEVWIKRNYMPEAYTVAPGGTIIDIGAHVGTFTVWAATTYPKARVIAVEPSPRMCTFLRRNVSKNTLLNVIILNAACSGKKGEAVLYSPGAEWANTLYSRDTYGNEFRPLARTKVMTLGDLFDAFEVKACSWLKMNCNGSEYEILFNAAASTMQKIERLSVAYHIGLNEHAPKELEEFLEHHKFKAVCLSTGEDVGFFYASRRF